MKLHSLLLAKLEPLASRRARTWLWLRWTIVWFIAAVCGATVLGLHRGRVASAILLAVFGVIAIGLSFWVYRRFCAMEPDYRALALGIERQHPELEGRLLTAVQQEISSDDDLNVLQQRVLDETLARERERSWTEAIPLWWLRGAQTSCAAAAILFTLVCLQWKATKGMPAPSFFGPGDPTVTVAPGDIELERGSSLVVIARFAKSLPANVEIVASPPIDGREKIPLVKSLADPMFGVTIPELNSNIVYHLEFGGKRTRDYKASVFDYPALERADADIDYPGYTGLARKHIANTRRLSAVEGSRAQVELKLNKAVSRAALLGRGTNHQRIELAIETNQPLVRLNEFAFTRSQSFDLQLIDLEGRTNKAPAQFVFEALPNRPPELKIASPRGDTRPSALEEISFEGTVWDDFGVKAYGLTAAVAGQTPRDFQLGTNVPGREKRTFNYLLRGEELELKPDDLVTWFVWAEDIGSDGAIRRTTGDLYFAEVRPFEEIFREGQSAGGEQQGQMGGGQGQAGQAAETEKQIISATWNLLRKGTIKSGSPVTNLAPKSERSSSITTKSSFLASGSAGLQPAVSQACSLPALASESDPAKAQSFPSQARLDLPRPIRTRSPYLAQQQQPDNNDEPPAQPRRRQPQPTNSQRPNTETVQDDINVIIEAQQDVLERVRAAQERQQDPRSSALWQAALNQLERALNRLQSSTNTPSELDSALAAEQAAYQALLKLQEREYSVTRNRNRQSGQSGRQQQLRQQLDQLDLSKTEDRYETERQAKPPQTAERSEQLQVMNRLQELARRQNDLNQQLKELQTALQQARTEQEREDIQRRLKRLQEEEQQLVADADELRQRMERPENQSRMSDQRRQVDQARNDLQRAAESTQQGQTSQALASGTRAQQQLQDAREQMRRESAGQFDQEMRDLRNEARELARREEEIQKQLENRPDAGRRTLDSGDPSQQTLEQLGQQRQRLTNVVDRATELSQQAEQAEPLMSKELYDTLRKFSQDDLSTLKEFQENLMNRGQISRELYQRLKQSEDSPTKSLDLTSELLKQGLAQDASAAQSRAQAGINDLKRGVEKAAGSVLGDEAQTLRRARDELNRLAEEVAREIAQGEGNQGTNNAPAAGAGQQEGSQTNSQQLAKADQGRASTSPSRRENDSQSGNQSQPNSSQPGDQARSNQPGGNQRGQNQPGQNQGGQNQDNQNQQQANNGSATDQQGQGSEGAPNQDRNGAGNQTAQNGGNRGGNGGGQRERGGERGGLDVDRFFEGRGGAFTGPIIGQDFGPWSDALREVEELVDAPTWRADVARARDQARQMRQDFRRAKKQPDWAQVRLQVLKPLVEVRDRVAEQLTRLGPGEQLVPIDRDPVPNRYSELVRKYYEELGKDRRERADSPERSPKQ